MGVWGLRPQRGSGREPWPSSSSAACSGSRAHNRRPRETHTMNPATDLVNRLWRLCALLRKDGVTYQQYVTELTYLLFLKMASEQKDESRIPERYRWGALKSASETEVLQRYRQALIDLGDGTKIKDRSVVAIFQNAATVVRE